MWIGKRWVRAKSSWFYLRGVRESGKKKVQDFRNLQVWTKAHKLTLEVYKLTANYPKDELFGLRSQMRRCAASIGSNIAEGCGKIGDAELNRYLIIAMGSASELEY